MKLTVLSKCFGKMKRVALTLFAALCVGSVWAEEGEGTEVTYVTTPMQDPSAGYIRTGLGTYGNEVAVVFTNHTAEATWTAPYNLNNVEFLVVGGGGGGGADSHWDDSMGGAGGGGGGVVTGIVANLTKGASLAVTVGAGGAGGCKATGSPLGSSGNGGDSEFKVDDVSYVKAIGGGGDGGAKTNTDMTGYAGKEGGSSGGSRAGQASVGKVKSAIINKKWCFIVL